MGFAVIILEGVNGVGKTTYAKTLSHVMGVPEYRAFKPPDANHYGKERERLRALGVPVNTFVDDMYLADMSRILDSEVIVDRSLPSAIAYEMVESQGTFHADWEQYATEWMRMLKHSRRPVLLVRLVAPYEIAYERMTQHRPNKGELQNLDDWLDRVFYVLDVPQLLINTAKVEIMDGILLVVTRMRRLCRQHLSNSGNG